MKRQILLLLTIWCITIDARAQVPPMPPLPVPSMGLATNSAYPMKRKVKTYTALCPHCRVKFSNLVPVCITTNGGMGTNGGTIVQRTITFGCPSRDCLENFDSQNTIFVPASVAVEDMPAEPAPTAQTWTTNSNLRLAIEIINKGSQLTLLGMTNNQVISNTVSLWTGPIPMAAIRFPTVMGKFYKCQATDDAKKTWLDGPIVAGTGNYVTNYEMPVKVSRMYRVVEM